MQKLIISGIVALFIIGCSSSKKSTDSGTHVSKKKPTEAQESMADRAGAVLYSQNCGKCHELFSPSAHSAEEWEKWVEVMQPNTELNDDEAELVLQYLQHNANPN